MTQSLLATPRAGAGRRRPELVVRQRLLRSLAQSCDLPLALLVAPAGYGKSTLLAQWAERDARPFAAVALRAADNEPASLLESIARAVSEVAPIDDDVFVALSRPPRAIAAEVLARLERSLADCPAPFVLILDDLDVIEAEDSLAALAALADRLPPESQLALASRREPALPIGRLRAQGRLFELRAPDLAMARREAAALFDIAGLGLGMHDVAALVQRTEGWPAGLALAALALRGEGDLSQAIERFGGSHWLVADYLRDELMRPLPDDERRFLTRISIMDVLSGPACDAVLARSGSGAVLRDLSRANVLLVQLDPSDCEYRLHRLFGEMLSAELRRGEPDRARELQRRASAWHTAQGDLDRAIHHAAAAEDAAAAGRLLWASAPGQVLCGRTATIRAWLDRFRADELSASPGLALTAAAAHLVTGERDLVEHWAESAQRALDAGSPDGEQQPFTAGVTIMRAAVARDGLERMTEDATTAYALAADDSPWRSLCCLLAGVGAYLTGATARARAQFQEGVRRGGIAAPAIQVLCLSQLALMAIDQEDWSEAELLISRARAQMDRVGLGDCPLCALAFAVSARIRAQRGRAEQAQADRGAAHKLLAPLTVVPWYEAQARIALAGAALRLGDVAASRKLLGDAARVAGEMPEATALDGSIQRSRSDAETVAVSVLGPGSLTTAELRILQMLPTHLSFREMAIGLHVSANTVKTHAQAVYRKLDACSRSEAVERARGAGLLGQHVDDAEAAGEWPRGFGGAEPDSLTSAELTVLRLLAMGLSFGDIGARQHVSARSVETHAQAVYRKLDACSRAEAISRAHATGLVDARHLARSGA